MWQLQWKNVNFENSLEFHNKRRKSCEVKDGEKNQTNEYNP